MKKAAIFFIKLYQRYISPNISPRCRFYPTCSEYSIQAIDRFGFFKGGLLAAWRILRCNPFGKGGMDPVPPTFTFKRVK